MHRDVNHAGVDVDLRDRANGFGDSARELNPTRDGIPASTTEFRSRLFSMISCAMRRSARPIASASRIWTAEEVRVGWFIAFLRDLAGSR
jgi:hypothetical protein